MDKAWVLKYKPQYDLEKGHENPTEAEIPKFGAKLYSEPRECLTELEEFISRFRHTSGVSYSFALRPWEEIIPPAEADDPTYGTIGSQYTSKDAKMIARHPIVAENDAAYVGADENKIKMVGPFDPTFQTVNEAMFHIFRTVFKTTGVWNLCQGHRKNRDGRSIFCVAQNYLCGPAYAQMLGRQNMDILNAIKYEGDSKGQDWRRVRSQHVKCFEILDSLRKDGQHSGMLPKERVTKLMECIQTSLLSSCKSVILSDDKYAENFEAAADYVQRCIDLEPRLQHKAASSRGRSNVSAVSTYQRDGSRGRWSEKDVQAAIKRMLKCYNTTWGKKIWLEKEEYKTLTKLERQAVYCIREESLKRGKNMSSESATESSGDGKASMKRNRELRREIATLKAQIADLDSDGEDSENDSKQKSKKKKKVSFAAKSKGNRGHRALGRQENTSSEDE